VLALYCSELTKKWSWVGTPLEVLGRIKWREKESGKSKPGKTKSRRIGHIIRDNESATNLKFESWEETEGKTKERKYITSCRAQNDDVIHKNSTLRLTWRSNYPKRWVTLIQIYECITDHRYYGELKNVTMDIEERLHRQGPSQTLMTRGLTTVSITNL
jgi:hypothetical protein